MERPELDKTLDSQLFKEYYYLKEELAAFCRQEGLQTTGGKLDLTERIVHYLKTGEKKSSSVKVIKQQDIGVITSESIIEKEFVCSEKHRAFFKQVIGKNFSFNVTFQKWLKANGGKTYREAIKAYYQILEDKKHGKTKIDKQFEYNTYIRDFFADNNGKSLDEAIKCWKYKKSLQGGNRYERTDLVILE